MGHGKDLTSEIRWLIMVIGFYSGGITCLPPKLLPPKLLVPFYTKITLEDGFRVSVQTAEEHNKFFVRKDFLATSSLRTDWRLESYMTVRFRVSSASEGKRKPANGLRQKSVTLHLYCVFVGHGYIQCAGPKRAGNKKIRHFIFLNQIEALLQGHIVYGLTGA